MAKPYLYAALVLFVILLAGHYLGRAYDELRLKNVQQELDIIVNQQALLIQKRLAQSLNATYLLARQVRHGNGEVRDFDSVAGQLIKKYGGITNLQLAPDGIIRQIYPSAGHEKAIGHNLLTDPNRTNAALKAIDTGLLTLAGPFPLLQGGIAVIGRNPVFLTKENKEYFWGFTSALILVDELLAVTELEELSNRGYYYKLSHESLENNRHVSFPDTELPAGLIHHSVSFDVPNNIWTLTLSTRKPEKKFNNLFFQFLWFICGALVAASTFNLLGQSERLRKIVRERSAELLESEERYRSIFQKSTSVMLLIDPEIDEIVDANDAAALFYRLNKEELKGKKISDINMLTREQVSTEMEAARSEQRKHFYFQHQLADNEIRDVEVYSGPVVLQGRKLLLSVIHDITERFQTQKALEQSEANLSKAQHLAHVGNWSWDLVSGIVLWSDELYRIYGLSPQEFEVSADSYLQFVHPYDIAKCEMFRDKALLEKEDYISGYRIIRRDKEVRHIVVQGDVTLDENGEVTHLFGTVQDVTDLKAAEAALRESEEKYKGIFNESVAAIYSFNSKKQFIDSNQAGLDLLGYSREELLTLAIPDVDAEPDIVIPLLNQLLGGEKIHNFEHQLIRKDGEIITVLHNSKPLQNDDGSVVGMQSTLIDISERKRLLKKLRKSEELYRGLVELSYDFIWEVDREGVYTYVSPNIEKILGYRPNEMLGKTPFDFIIEEQIDEIRKFFKNVIDDAQPIVALENINRHKNGHLITLESSGSPFFDETGEVAGYRGVDRNITERKEIEEEKEKIQEAVIESKNMWEKTFDTIPLMICILDENHKIKRINKVMADSLGKSCAELINTQCFSCVHCSESPPDYCPHSKLLKDHKEHYVEIYADHLKSHLAVTVAPLYDARDRFIGSVHIAQNINRQKEQEERLQKFNEQLQEMVEEQTSEIKKKEKLLLHAEKLNAVGRFSASIAHEFNNPLQGVLNVVKGVQSRCALSEQDDELVELALKECYRMKDLIQNLLQFHRPSSGVRKELDIHRLIDDVLLFAQKEFKSKQIKIIRNYLDDLPAVWAVEDQIKQVLVNILGNGCDAISSPHGELTIATTRLDDETLCISVKDTGEGIKPENLQNIFEPFFTTKGVTGTGLGLSISYGIITSHGGDIKVESKPGKGTVFLITLPIRTE
ncbi:MAG: PAS domain S-box protein [Thermodesulfobacteriota bacterium]